MGDTGIAIVLHHVGLGQLGTKIGQGFVGRDLCLFLLGKQAVRKVSAVDRILVFNGGTADGEDPSVKACGIGRQIEVRTSIDVRRFAVGRLGGDGTSDAFGAFGVYGALGAVRFTLLLAAADGDQKA